MHRKLLSTVKFEGSDTYRFILEAQTRLMWELEAKPYLVDGVLTTDNIIRKGHYSQIYSQNKDEGGLRRNRSGSEAAWAGLTVRLISLWHCHRVLESYLQQLRGPTVHISVNFKRYWRRIEGSL